jgi:DNA-binding transcriptional MocR family regulator
MVESEPGGKAARANLARAAVFTPLYKQIKRLLLEDLDRGAWKPGELIPSEFELAGRFQVSQGTVRKAVDELAAENLLVRRQGKGTSSRPITSRRRSFASCASCRTRAGRCRPRAAFSSAGVSAQPPTWRARSI